MKYLISQYYFLYVVSIPKQKKGGRSLPCVHYIRHDAVAKAGFSVAAWRDLPSLFAFLVLLYKLISEHGESGAQQPLDESFQYRLG